MSGRLQEDGSILYPRRGNPPKAPEGFESDPGDPFILRPVFEPCDNRKIQRVILPCGNVGGRHMCVLKGVDISPGYCDDCPDRIDSTPKVIEENLVQKLDIEQ